MIYIVAYFALLAFVLLFNYGASKVTGEFHTPKPVPMPVDISKVSGFTLIELIVAVAIMCVMALIICAGIFFLVRAFIS